MYTITTTITTTITYYNITITTAATATATHTHTHTATNLQTVASLVSIAEVTELYRTLVHSVLSNCRTSFSTMKGTNAQTHMVCVE